MQLFDSTARNQARDARARFHASLPKPAKQNRKQKTPKRERVHSFDGLFMMKQRRAKAIKTHEKVTRSVEMLFEHCEFVVWHEDDLKALKAAERRLKKELNKIGKFIEAYRPRAMRGAAGLPWSRDAGILKSISGRRASDSTAGTA